MRRVLIDIAVAALYIACAKVGLALAFEAAQVTVVWPATGFAIAAMLRFGPRIAPAIFIGALVANATAGEPLWVASGIAAGNMLEALVATSLLRRVGFDARLSRVRDVVALLGAIAASAIVAASIGVFFLVAGGVQPSANAATLWRLWWLGDVLGGLIFAPSLLVWSHGARLPSRRGALVEGVALTLLFFAASAIAFLGLPILPSVEFLVFPFLIWAALRFGPAGAASFAVATNVIAVLGTWLGRGPFAGAGPEQGLVLLQVFMSVAATTGLFLGAVAEQNREAQERSEMSERRLLLAMSGARIGVWEWHVRTGEVIWSEGSEPLHGLPRGGFAGTFDAFRSLIHPDERARVEEAIHESVETRRPYEEEFRIQTADGTGRWMSARGVVVEDAAGEVRMVGVAIDVTPKKELEEKLRRNVRELADVDRRKDEFLAMLGHELRNPLAPIVHAAELLGRQGDAMAREIIRRQTGHLTRIVNDLLDVSRITRGTVRLACERVRASEVIESAVETWRHAIEQRRQRLTIEIPDDPIWIDVDPTRLAQVISNLLHNAAKFTPVEGALSIRVRVEEGWMVLRVKDSGAGMSPDVLAHAFDLFVQGPPSLDRTQGGLGLGLTLVRRLVELHGGRVEATSEGPGMGSEVSVRIPVSTAPAPKPARSAPAPVRRRRVLLVEDNLDARFALGRLLEEEGHEVFLAQDGADAIAQAQSLVPDVVLLDIGLPGVDGYSVARKLRALPQCAGALMIAITGYGQLEDRVQAASAGFDHHLLKPVDVNRLFELLNREPAR